MYIGGAYGGGIFLFGTVCPDVNILTFIIMIQKSRKSPKGKLAEVDGISYQVIDGKLCRYADLTLDKGFKIVLGRPGSEEVLKHLLNRILGTSIQWLEYRNTEHPGLTEEERSSRFDVYCEDASGGCFQVEMQNWSQRYYNKRAVYYSSLVMQDQAAKAQRLYRELHPDKAGKNWDYDYQPMYVLSFLNFKNWTSDNVEDKTNPYISIYRYMDVETGEKLGDGTSIVFVDLFGFSKKEEECETLEDFWMYSLKNMSVLDSCPEKAKGTEIEELYIRSELAKMTVEQRIKYEESIMTENDILNSIEEQLEEAREIAEAEGWAKGEAEGREEGRAEGKAEGRAEGRKEVIQQLYSKGMSIEQIAGLLDVDPKEIEDLV